MDPYNRLNMKHHAAHMNEESTLSLFLNNFCLHTHPVYCQRCSGWFQITPPLQVKFIYIPEFILHTWTQCPLKEKMEKSDQQVNKLSRVKNTNSLTSETRRMEMVLTFILGPLKRHLLVLGFSWMVYHIIMLFTILGHLHKRITPCCKVMANMGICIHFQCIYIS